MCFYISVNSTKKKIENIFDAHFELENKFIPNKDFNGFVNPKIPVITNDKPNKILMFDWGLIPHWIKSLEKANDIRNKTLNARSETLEHKPSFKSLIGKRHCIVIIDGFYEWRHEGKNKMKHHIYINSKKLFAFAGIWDSWKNEESGEIINSFSIITQKACGVMEYIHNSNLRQPVILDDINRVAWNQLKNHQEIIYNSAKVNLEYSLV
jgi:putative SOS response-associated peptidase YedK